MNRTRLTGTGAGPRRAPVIGLRPVLLATTLAAAMALGGCSDPYDPGQRAVGGGLLGAGGGALLGGIAGGGRGAAIGALAGGALGAGAGAATTPRPPPPPPPPPGYYNQAPGYYNY